MIRFSTRMEALLFNNYGNHCGGGDSTGAPVIDAIDEYISLAMIDSAPDANEFLFSRLSGAAGNMTSATIVWPSVRAHHPSSVPT